MLEGGYQVHGCRTYIIFKCAGCDDVKMKMEIWNSEITDVDNNPIVTDFFYPPSIYRPKPKWFWLIDRNWHIAKLFDEVYMAIHNSANALASMGIRSIIESVMIDKVSDSGTFAKNLKNFQEKGYVSRIQVDALTVALELGHASIHRGHVPEEYQVSIALDITEALVHQLYVVPETAEFARKNIPARNSV